MFGYSQEEINKFGDKIIDEYKRKLEECKTEAEVDLIRGYAFFVLSLLPKYQRSILSIYAMGTTREYTLKLTNNATNPILTNPLEPSISDRLTKLEKAVESLTSGERLYHRVA